MKKSQIRLLYALLVLWLLYFSYQTINKNGIGLTINNFGDFETEIIKSPPGIEDITMDPETKIAYLSSHNRREFDSLGDLYAYDTQSDSIIFQNLTGSLKIKEFRPHGISFIKLNDGRKFLFAVSHSDLKHDVLKFEILGDSLQYIQRYSSTDFVSPNDIIAIGENQFFITNDHNTRKKWQVFLHDLFRIPTGNITLFDGQRTKVVSNKIVYPNGISLSQDKSRIFVTSTLDKKIMEFKPLSINQPLKLISEANMKYAPDNIELDENGDLIIACHPKTLDFMSHRKNSDNLSPSSVFLVDKENLNKQTEVFTDKGTWISGSSVAVTYKNSKGKQSYIIGCVFDKKVLKLSEKK